MQAENVTNVRCCIAGGGPAGVMLGFLLARAGIDVLVLEKHADFLRDFRGDTIHPSTLEVLHELGLLREFLDLPHQKIEHIAAQIGGVSWPVADFTHLPTRCQYIALMPQWDFLNFLAEQGRRYSGFHLRLGVAATGLLERHGQVVGLRAAGPGGELIVHSDLVIAADGRRSTVRALAGLTACSRGAPMDVLWFKLPRHRNDPGEVVARFAAGNISILINRGDYWQCAYVIPKDSFAAIKARGVHHFKRDVAQRAPLLADRVESIAHWDDVKLLKVGVDRLKRWYKPGLLCIGDAAHTMSPIGGVGINLAVQDAVATAERLAAPLREKQLTVHHLRRLQHRRQLPARLTQGAQLLAQKRVIGSVLKGGQAISVPLPLRLLAWFPPLRRIPARIIGLGFRPEHVRSVARPPPANRTR